MTLSIEPRPFLTSLFWAAVNAADPAKVMPAFLPAPPKGRTIVIGCGKGAAQMALAFELVWPGPIEGAVVTRYGFGAPCKRIEVMESSHPVPDAAGLKASKRLSELVSGLTADDLVIALICGGGSALLPAPAGLLTLEDEIAVNRELLASGAPISAMNAIRKHVSKIKGGRLAALAFPAKVVSLIVSDVPGDIASYVASGPTVPDMNTRQDALRLIGQYRMTLPDAVMRHLNSPEADAPLPSDKVFANNEVHIIASAAVSLEAAAAEARRQGIEAVILSDALEGEAREAAKVHAAIAREVSFKGRPFKTPVVILSGGETTVTLTGKGKGGRNTEFLLSFARAIEGCERIDALAADTDGIDGSEDNAGAFADGGSAARMREAGLDPAEYQRGNDAFTAFSAIGDIFHTGPTGTNVNDFRAILVR
jgi:glycerate 2-kinase